MGRIVFLDGLRGVAILLVICFHTYSRWPEIVPYGTKFADFPPFRYGYLGVQLFFLISGFVILMSLERSKNYSQFIFKRWLRLFPAMFVATLLIYFTAPFFDNRPRGIPQLIDVIPGLLFIEPKLIKLVTGLDISSLEGAFWSLFVEVKFYLIFGLLYFWLGKIKAIVGLVFLFMFSVIAVQLNNSYLELILKLLSFQHFSWFASGALAYLYFTSKEIKYMIFSLLVMMVQLLHSINFYEFCGSLTISLLFYLPICTTNAAKILNNKFFLFFGIISYPLYLIHENALISMIYQLGKISSMPNIILPVIPLIILSIIAYIIAKVFEPFILNVIKRH